VSHTHSTIRTLKEQRLNHRHWLKLDCVLQNDKTGSDKPYPIGIYGPNSAGQLVVNEFHKPPRMGFPTLIVIDGNKHFAPPVHATDCALNS